VIAMMLVLSPRAQAAPADRVAIATVAGPQAARVERVLEAALLPSYTLIPDVRVRKEARRRRLTLRDDGDFGRLGRSLGAGAILSAQVDRRRRGWQVRLVIRDGDTGAAAGRISVTGPHLDRVGSSLAIQAAGKIGALLAQRAAAARRLRDSREAVRRVAAERPPGEVVVDADATATTPATAAAAPAPADAEASAEAPLGPPLVLSVDARLFSRSFGYTENGGGFPGAELRRAVSTAAELSLRAGRWLPQQALAPLGVVAGIEKALGGRTTAAASTAIGGYRLAVDYRLGGAAAMLIPEAGFAAHSFTVDDPAAQAPDVQYRLLTVGTRAGWTFAPRFLLGAKALYLHGLSAGAPQTARLPDATISGVEAEATLAYAVWSGLELRASLGVRRLDVDAGARPGDRPAAGGAFDRTTWSALGLAYRH
jgi:hypothetical protein